MAGSLYGFPFNEELFLYKWGNEPDPITRAFVDSGVMQENAEIANLISTGSDTYTIPFYKTIGGTPANYDGKTDIPIAETEGAAQTGVVWGRSQGWSAKDFVIDFNSGADPMDQIVSQVAGFWAKYRQRQLVNILNGVFGATNASDPNGYYAKWANHSTNLASSTTTVAATNKLGATSIGDAATKACGDLASGAFNLAIMHSTVAKNLANQNLLEFRKYTDPMGMERRSNIADIDGCTVVTFDGVPYEPATSGKAAQYTTYVLGTGAIQKASAPVENPVNVTYDAIKNGGMKYLTTKERITMQPNGFSFNKQTADVPSPTDEALGTASRWEPIYDPKCIAMAKIVSNG